METLSVTAQTVGELDAASWAKTLKPGGKLTLSVADEALVAEAKLPLLVQGFVIETTGAKGLVATKPQWEAGSKSLLKRGKAAAADDMVDEDDLLAADGLEAPPVPEDAGCSARKPCANCTCGRADAAAAAGPDPTAATPTSSCGNCHKGDAFRCAGCPYLGKPAFKPGEETLVLEMTDDL